MEHISYGKVKLDGDNCAGIVVRASVHNYFMSDKSGARIVHRISLNILKKKTCVGCKHCCGLSKGLDIISNEYPVKGIDQIEHGQLYRINGVDNLGENDFVYKLEKLQEQDDFAKKSGR